MEDETKIEQETPKCKHIEVGIETHRRVMMAKARLGKKRVEDVILLGLELIDNQLFTE